MKRLKLLGAAVALAATLPLVPSPSFAQGYGPCTPPAGKAVGSAGPAMSGGQLMAGIGQCRRIAGGHWHHGRAYWHRGYGGPNWGSYARY